MQVSTRTPLSAIRVRLTQAGHPTSSAEQLSQCFRRAATSLGSKDSGSGGEGTAFFVPGRIEVLGKHTDYAGGSSLTCATTRGFCVVVAPDASSSLTIIRADTGETEHIDVRDPSASGTHHWSVYPRAVVRRVVQAVGDSTSADALAGGVVSFSSTLPVAAGMSSSSALVIACFLALRTLNTLQDRPAFQKHLSSRSQIAAYLAAVESGRSFGPFSAADGVGTEGGSEDHTAILCAASGALRRFSYDPVHLHQTVTLADRWRFVIGDSGVKAEKTGTAQSAYNDASRWAAEAARHWREQTGSTARHLGAVMRENNFTMSRLRRALRTAADTPEPLIQRVEHFYAENQEIMPAAMEALMTQDWKAFGTLVDQSQSAADTLLGNQVPETIYLARSARRLGAVAASSFGAGFGGAVWALVAHEEADTFQAAWRADYSTHFPERVAAARFFTEQPGPAAFQV